MQPESNNEWSLVEPSFEANRLTHYEGLFTLGSGVLHVRGSLEESIEPQDDEYLRLPTNVTAERHRERISRWGVYLPAVTGRNPVLNAVVVNLPWPLEISVAVDSIPLIATSPKLVRYVRRLDMREAVLYRSSEWEVGDGRRLVLETTRFVSRRRPYLIVQRFDLELRGGAGRVEITSGIDARVRTNGHNHFESVTTRAAAESPAVTVVTDLGRTVSVAASHTSSLPSYEADDSERNHPVIRWIWDADPEGTLRIEKFSVVTADTETDDDPEQAANHGADEGRRIGYTDLYDEHVADWADLWRRSKVTVDSDQPLQRDLNASIYHMLRAHRKGETRFSICPKAHAGEAYFGRYFWDTEIFLLPFFIYTDPDHARDLLRFRISTLSGAKRNAGRYGYAGARYAWESSLNGDEECPNWQYADHEIHVTADVVYGLLHYIRATGDIDFALREAFPVFVETARYWVSRTDRLEDGTHHLLGVMGPDEYSPFSRDNAYTNRLVRFSLNATVEFANLCRLEHPDLFAGYERDLQLTDGELQLFSMVASELPVVIDSKLNIVLQSADFETCAHLDELDSLRAGADPVGAVVSQERLYRSKALKQGDVVMLFALFPDEYSEEIVNRSFDYYEALTTHDSSLSPTVHALVASRLGRREVAERFFALSLNLDFHPQKGDASQGIHAANAGGNWQIAVFGYAGVRPAGLESTLRLKPSLPESVRRIGTPLCWRGRRLDLIVTRSDVQIMLLAGAPLEVDVSGEVAVIEVDRMRTFHYSSS